MDTSSRRVRIGWLWLAVVCSLLVACGGNAVSPVQSARSVVQVVPAERASGIFHEYALPQANSGLMRPVLDTRGRVWFGEMNSNYLGAFDPVRGQFWQRTPPDGKYGIMGLLAVPDGTVWFAEQYANYLGQYDPQSGRFRSYALPQIVQPDPADPHKTQLLPAGPNDLALDAQGRIWFTEINTNAIGSLDPADGAVRQYQLTAGKSAALVPYGIVVDRQGIVWFTTATTSRLGRLDPRTGRVSYFVPPGVNSSLMELALAANGQIWATTFSAGLLLRFDPVVQHFSVYAAPGGASVGGLYGLTVVASGEVWVAVTSANLLARFDPQSQRFVYYPVPTASSAPLGLAVGPQGSVWFTESNSNKIGQLLPSSHS